MKITNLDFLTEIKTTQSDNITGGRKFANIFAAFLGGSGGSAGGPGSAVGGTGGSGGVQGGSGGNAALALTSSSVNVKTAGNAWVEVNNTNTAVAITN